MVLRVGLRPGSCGCTAVHPYEISAAEEGLARAQSTARAAASDFETTRARCKQPTRHDVEAQRSRPSYACNLTSLETSQVWMSALSKIAARSHASTGLVAAGFVIAAAGSTGCGYWHHVGMDAGTDIFYAGVVVSFLEMRVIGWRQVVAQIAVIVPLLLLPMHVH